jgi:ribosomal protein S8E
VRTKYFSNLPSKLLSWVRIQMGFNQGNDLKKVTGGRKRPHRKPRKREIGGYPVETKLSDKEIRIVERVYGGNVKIRLKYATFANVYNPKTKQYSRPSQEGIVNAILIEEQKSSK